MKNSFPTIIAATTMLILCGCSTPFQANQLDEVAEYPAVNNPKSIYVDLAFAGKLNGEVWTDNDQENKEYLEQRFSEKLEESGMFSFVSDGLKTTDFQLYVAVINDRKTDRTKQALCALTLFLIPYTEVDEFRMMAILKQPSTGKEFKFSLNDGVNHRQAILLAPLAPFKPTEGELVKCTDRLIENLCLQIHGTGSIK